MGLEKMLYNIPEQDYYTILFNNCQVWQHKIPILYISLWGLPVYMVISVLYQFEQLASCEVYHIKGYKWINKTIADQGSKPLNELKMRYIPHIDK